jgi:hypothetical protein
LIWFAPGSAFTAFFLFVAFSSMRIDAVRSSLLALGLHCILWSWGLLYRDCMIIDSVDFSFCDHFHQIPLLRRASKKESARSSCRAERPAFRLQKSVFYGFHVRYALPKLHRSRVKNRFPLEFRYSMGFLFHFTFSVFLLLPSLF